MEIVNYPWTGIKETYAPIGTKVDWDKIILKGFHILPRRWFVERTNAWITHHRRLSRDFWGTHTSSEAFFSLAMIKIMSLLADASDEQATHPLVWQAPDHEVKGSRVY